MPGSCEHNPRPTTRPAHPGLAVRQRSRTAAPTSSDAHRGRATSSAPVRPSDAHMRTSPSGALSVRPPQSAHSGPVGRNGGEEPVLPGGAAPTGAIAGQAPRRQRDSPAASPGAPGPASARRPRGRVGMERGMATIRVARSPPTDLLGQQAPNGREPTGTSLSRTARPPCRPAGSSDQRRWRRGPPLHLRAIGPVPRETVTAPGRRRLPDPSNAPATRGRPGRSVASPLPGRSSPR